MTQPPPPAPPATERTSGGWRDDLLLARELAEVADAISLPRFGAADLAVDAKPDMSPVSDADLAVERALRAVLSERRPGDAVLGEEFGDGSTGSAGTSSSPADPITRAGQGRCWVIDPIDGTKNFVRGVPIWATLIALLVDSLPVAGVVSAPALARRWWGGVDLGSHTAFAGGPARQCRVSGVTDVADASLSLSQLHAWEKVGLGGRMRALSRRCWRSRGYGDFFSYMLVAEGAVDIAAEPELSLWDLAALAPIVTAAGGRFTTVTGGRIDAEAGSAVATNGALHPAVIRALSPDEQ